MDIRIAALLLTLPAGFALVRLFASPLKLVLRIALNTALGLLLLWLLQRSAPVTHFPLGLNFFNAVTVGLLGVPGLILLLLLHTVFI